MQEMYHFIGIGGIGMSGLAQILLSKNISVSGSDIALSPVVEQLIQRGAQIHKGHDAKHVLPGSKVVYSTDISPNNPEYQAALSLNCQLLHRSDLLAELLAGQRALAVSGTHGKTTTSALLATVLLDAGWDPSFAVGGILPAYQTNAKHGAGEWFVFEADESDRSFLKYHPYGAIVTNVDKDHMVNYNNDEALLVHSFQTFMGQVASPEALFWCGDDLHLRKLSIPGQCYGFHDDCDWRISAYRQTGFQTVFDLKHQGHHYEAIELSLIGRHNVQNAAAVFGLGRSIGIPEAALRVSLKGFKGVLRRCEQKGSYRDVLFLDDYAHHPTEIQTTLKGIREAIGSKRLIAVFQPHRYSRMQECLGRFGAIFDSADEVLITDIYGAGEEPIPHLTHEVVLHEVRQGAVVPCNYIPRSALSHYLCHYVRPEDVVVTLGAGDVTRVGTETLVMLEKLPVKQ